MTKKNLITDFFTQIFLQLRIWKKLYPGIMHFLIFWGVSIQLVGTANWILTPQKIKKCIIPGYSFFQIRSCKKI